MEPTRVRLTIPDSVDPGVVMGPADRLLRLVEGAFDASVTVRGNQVLLAGSAVEVDRLTSVFSRLIAMVEAGEVPAEEDVRIVLGQVEHGMRETGVRHEDVLISSQGHAVRPKTDGQARYVEAIRTNSITFGLGPAGTGKTYLAMAMAVAALKRHEVSRIVLVRPVVEAGESLGFLPGTLQEKLDPYVRPLYDALFDMTDPGRGSDLIDQGVIEIVPLAFMRGRTLNGAFVILDEAQNTTPEQMKMFLTRLGYGSTFVVTGDLTQRDLLGPSGLESARELLSDIDDIAFVDFDRNDIVRHSLVARIVDAYERGEATPVPREEAADAYATDGEDLTAGDGTPSPSPGEVDITCEEGVEAPLDAGEVRAICAFVMAEEGVTRPWELSVSFVGDERIAQLNAEWRGVEGPTDVISLECERPDDPGLAPGEVCSLGDVILAPAYIARQARAMGTTRADESRLLLVHGLLHLLGYDHLEDDEAERMERREDELCARLARDGSLSAVTLTRHREGSAS